MPTTRETIEYVLKLTGGLKEDAIATADAVDSVGSAAVGATKVVATFASGALAAAASFYKLADSMYGVVDTLGDLSAASGLSAGTINGLRIAAKATGGELESLVPTDLANNMAKAAEGGKKASGAFGALGVQVVDASGRFRDADLVFRETIDALSKIPDPATKAALATRTLGSAGAELLGTFEDSDGLDRFVAGAQEFGINAGPRAVAQATAWQAATSNLSLAFEDSGFALVSAYGDSATNLVNNLSLGMVFLSNLVGGLADVLFEVRDQAVENAVSIAGAIQDAFAGRPIELNLTTPKDIREIAAAGIEAATLGAVDAADQFWQTFLKPPASSGTGTRTGGSAPSFGGSGTAAVVVDIPQFAEMKRWNINDSEQVRKLATEIRYLGEDVTEYAAAIHKQTSAIAAGYLGAASTGKVSAIAGTALSNAGPIGALVSGLIEVAKDLPGLAHDLTADFKSIVNGLPRGLNQIIQEVPQTIMDTLPDLIASVASLIPAIIDGVVSMMGEIFSAEFWSSMGKAFVDAFREAFKGLFGGMFDKNDGKGPQRDAGDLGGNYRAAKGDKLKGVKIPSFAEQTPMIRQSGLAIVHRGEEIRKAGSGGPSLNMSVTVIADDPIEFARQMQRLVGPYGYNLSLAGRS